MNKNIFILVGVFLLLLMMVSKVASGNTSTIIISGADAQITRYPAASSAVNTLLAAVPDHFIVSYADINNKVPFHIPSSTLQGFLSAVPDRVVIQYGDRNRLINVGYPKELIGDAAPPQVLSINPQPSGSSAYLLSFDTNEYAICACNYGTSSGVYPQISTEDLYATSHQLSMTNLEEGSQVFYKISCTDRSLNTMQTQEYSFEAIEERSLYLPMITR